MKRSQRLTVSEHADGTSDLSRRAAIAQVPGAAIALLLSGTLADSAQARGHDRRWEGTVEVLPDGVLIQLYNSQVLVQQIADGQIALDVASLEDPANPIYSSIHSGVLTEELIDTIAGIGRRGVSLDDVRRYFALLRGFGLTGSLTQIIPVVLGIIIAIIIICAIIGSSFDLGYEY